MFILDNLDFILLLNLLPLMENEISAKDNDLNEQDIRRRTTNRPNVG
jgi:hypothetical protein